MIIVVSTWTSQLVMPVFLPSFTTGNDSHPFSNHWTA